MFFKIYCQDVKSDADLDKFGFKQAEISKSSNYINLEFVPHEIDKTSNYLDHQTYTDNNFGYYFSEKIALFEIFSGRRIVVKYFNRIDNDLIHTLLNLSLIHI